MKIQCSNCATVFFIDDSLISGKGVKAQCPRCGHQTVVRSDGDSSPPPAAQDPPGPGLNYGSQPPPSEQPSGQPPPPAGGPSDSGFFGEQGDYFGGNNYFGGAAPASSAPVPGVAPVPGMTSPPGATPAPNVPGAVPGMAPTPYAGPQVAYQPHDPLSGYVAQPTQPPQQPSSPVLGGLGNYEPQPLIEEKTALSRAPEPPEPVISHEQEATRVQPHPSTPYASGSAQGDLGRLDPNWLKVRRISDGQELGPVSLKEVRSLYVHGKISLDDEYAGQDLNWTPIREVPALLDILQRTPQLGQQGGPKSATRSRSNNTWLVLVLALLIGGGGVGAYFYIQSQKKTQKKPDLTQGNVPVNLLNQWRDKWAQQYPSVKKGAASGQRYTQKGLAALAEDQERSYQHAIGYFKRALLANPKSDQALAGLAIANIWSPPSRRGSSAAYEHKRNQFEVLLRRKSQTRRTAILRATYALYLKDDPDKALSLLKYSAHKAPNDPLVRLIAGSIWLNQQQDYNKARLHLQHALKRNKELARARVLLARVMLKKSRYYQAQQLVRPLLPKRHPEATYFRARMYIHTGKYAQARVLLRKLLRRDRNNHRARLLLGTLQYQMLRSPKQALRTLQGFRKGARLKLSQRLQWLLHLGYLRLGLGQYKRTQRLVAQLKKLDRTYLPALFLQAQLALRQKKYDAAAQALTKMLHRLPSDTQIQTLLAWVQEHQGQHAKAEKLYRSLGDQNTRYIWPRLLLAGLMLRKNKTDKTLLELKSALDVEPDLLHNQLRPTKLYITPSTWQPLVQRFVQARKGPRSIFLAAAGMVSYQMGLTRQASSFLRQSLRRDSKGLAANLYMAQIHYDARRYAQAQRHAARVYRVYDQHAIAAQILGLIALQRRQFKQARTYLAQVRRARPWFISSQVGMALVLLHQNKRKDALYELKSLLDSYNYHHFLARALIQLKR